MLLRWIKRHTDTRGLLVRLPDELAPLDLHRTDHVEAPRLRTGRPYPTRARQEHGGEEDESLSAHGERLQAHSAPSLRIRSAMALCEWQAVMIFACCLTSLSALSGAAGMSSSCSISMSLL